MQMALDVVAGDALKIEEKIAVDFVEKEEMIVENGAQKVEQNILEKPQNNWNLLFDHENFDGNFCATKPLFDDFGGKNFLFDFPKKKLKHDSRRIILKAFEKMRKIL
jgi:hypothetical protein